MLGFITSFCLAVCDINIVNSEHLSVEDSFVQVDKASLGLLFQKQLLTFGDWFKL